MIVTVNLMLAHIYDHSSPEDLIDYRANLAQQLDVGSVHHRDLYPPHEYPR